MSTYRVFTGLLLLAAILILLAMTLKFIGKAHGSPLCLTHKEARELWPKQHIWWYSSDRCWSNRRGGPPRGLKLDPVDDPVFPNKSRRSMAHEPDEEDKCCWPQLDYDADGNVIEPPRTFPDRWQDQPWIGRSWQ